MAIDAPRTVSWTVTATIRVGHRACYVCEVATPTPTDVELIQICREKLRGNDSGGVEFQLGYVWPGDSENHWWPRGWHQLMTAGPGSEPLLLCPKCVEPVESLLVDLMKKHESEE